MFEGVPPEVADALTAELDPGERVVWQAMPSLRYKTWNPVLVFLLVVLFAAFCWKSYAAFHLKSPALPEAERLLRGFVLGMWFFS